MRYFVNLGLCLCAALILCVTLSSGQTASAQNYTVTSTTGASIVPGTTDTGNHCDDCQSAITLPFPFKLYDQTFTTAQAGSNGYLSFANFYNGFFAGCLPPAVFTYTIFPFATDQITDPTGKGIFTTTTGSAPTRTFYIEYRTCRYDDATGLCLANSNANYEVVLQEGQSNFQIIYGAFGSANASAGAVGVEKNASIFTQYRCNSGAPPSGTQLTFTPPPTLIISEFRLSGPAGAQDEFIELYNTAATPLTVQAGDASAGLAVAASDGVARCTVPNGTVIPGRGHYLCANNTTTTGYSLGNYPAGSGTTATPNATYTTDIPNNAGIALFNTATPANFTLANRLDAVGSNTEANTLYKEGTGYPALTPFSIDYSFYRKNDMNTGLLTDTNDNATDFLFVDTNGTSHLGAPGPENLSSPTIKDRTQISGANLDPTVAQSASPNRVRDYTPVTNGTQGTLSIRRTYTNNTGGNITRLRFRLIDITTLPAPSGTADLRAITSTTNTVPITGGSVSVQGLTLETPPFQSAGGGFNSSLSANTIQTATPLANGATIAVNFLMGVQQAGAFRFFINVEALP